MSPQRSCCILTVSSTITQAKKFVERIVAVSIPASKPAAFAEATTRTLELPWTISNKYYTAPVQFSVIETLHIKSEDAADIPACIFVFSATEPFKEDFNTLMSRFERSDFEVSIAVSVPASDTGSFAEDELCGLEAFFGEHGFEYVNGHSGPDLSLGHDTDDMDGIPGIGRVVDALSTILWPSMVQNPGSRRAKARSVVSVPGPPEEEDGLRALLNADKDASTNTILPQERVALDDWLEEAADDDKDPWEGQESRPDEHDSGVEAEASRLPTSGGFDDNFNDLVSARAQADARATDTDDFNMVSTEEMDEDDSQTPFDLSRVLGALEAMKEEIVGMTDEDEKRKAAAKAALGIVYGRQEG